MRGMIIQTVTTPVSDYGVLVYSHIGGTPGAARHVQFGRIDSFGSLTSGVWLLGHAAPRKTKPSPPLVDTRGHYRHPQRMRNGEAVVVVVVVVVVGGGDMCSVRCAMSPLPPGARGGTLWATIHHQQSLGRRRQWLEGSYCIHGRCSDIPVQRRVHLRALPPRPPGGWVAARTGLAGM